MADRSGAAAAAEPAAAAAASQPSSQNQRRSSRLSTDDDDELVSLAEEELPAVAQRRALDAAPVEADDYLQVRSRVSCEARCFDTKGGTSWSRLTFGEAGSTTRIFGTVKEVLDDSGGRNRKASKYRVAWDIDVPTHDASRGPNASSIGRKAFTYGQLRREHASAGRRLTCDLSGPSARPALQPGLLEQNADDSQAPALKEGETITMSTDNSLTDSEDEDWDPAQDSGGETDDEEFKAPTESRDELLLNLPAKEIAMGTWSGHEVKWKFDGCSQSSMDSASLPWSLDGPAGWGPAADPYRDMTNVSHHSQAFALETEMDRFLKFYPGGLDAMIDDVEKINTYGTQSASASNPWATIDIWDWLAFLSVLFGNTRSDGNWTLLFDSGNEDYAELFGRPTFKDVISKSRFDRIRKCAHSAFNSTDRETVQYDPWHPFRDFVTRYNSHMQSVCKFGRYWCLDESMSPYQPRADKYGGLPHLSYIQRKPKPFGVEYKTVCTADGLMSFLEIQEGAEPMKDKEIDGYASGASKTIRMCAPANPGMVVIGDSDFGSVPAAWYLATERKLGCILNVKTAHKHFPKDFLETNLTGTGAGTTLVLTATIGGVRMNAIGYKYARSKKAQFFIATVGDFDTAWKPYIARFKDVLMNTVSRPVPRPRVLAVYYAKANVVDVHNQGRQDLIHLESSWPTRNCWFRQLCTGMGIVAENALKEINYTKAKADRLSHDRFVRRLSHQLGTVKQLTKSDGTVLKRPGRSTSPVPNLELRVVSAASPQQHGGGAQRSVSPQLITFDGQPHEPDWNDSTLRCRWCAHLWEERGDTKLFCKQCKEPFCSKLTTGKPGRDCFQLHAVHGIPPKKVLSAKSSEAQRVKWGKIRAEDINHHSHNNNQKKSKKAAQERAKKLSKK